MAISSSMPNSSLAASVGFSVLPEGAAGLAFRDHVADDAEVVAEVGRGEPLHELGGLPQLDLEHDGEVAVAAHAIEVQAGDGPQLRQRIVEAGDALAPGGDRLLHRLFEDRDEQVVLAAEVEVDRAGGDAGGPRHVGDLGVEVAARGEGFDRGAQQRVALVAALGLGGGRTAAAGRHGGHE